jgi:hypothetical protein
MAKNVGGERISNEAYQKELEVQAELQEDLAKQLAKRYQKVNDLIKEQGTLEAFNNGLLKERDLIAGQLKDKQDGTKDLSLDVLASNKEQINQQKKLGKAVNEIFPGAMSFATSVEDSARGMAGILGPASMAVALFIALAKFALDYGKAIADTRKELGVSVVTAAKLNAQNRLLGIQAKLYGLELEDVKSAQNTILKDLGGSVDEALKLSVNFARTSAATGQTSDELGKTLSIMESISSASRDVLLNQIRANAAMIEAQGVAPGLVMRDIAANAEFFAEFAKDGGKNLIMAGTAARKLGLDMSAVADATNSLLEFESSIESSMEASLLLGRQINTDRARMLALTGDQEGLMKEIQRIAGSEQEFNQMNVLARRALAKSLGQSVEGLARIVRNNQAGATGAAAGGAMGSIAEKQLSTQKQMVEGIHQVADNTRQPKSY